MVSEIRAEMQKCEVLLQKLCRCEKKVEALKIQLSLQNDVVATLMSSLERTRAERNP